MNTCLEGVQRDADSQAFWTLCEMEGVRFTRSFSLPFSISFFFYYLFNIRTAPCVPPLWRVLDPSGADGTLLCTLQHWALWQECSWAHAKLSHPQNGGRALLQPGSRGCAHRCPVSLGTLDRQLPKQGADKNTEVEQTHISMDASSLAAAAAEGLVPARMAPASTVSTQASKGERDFLWQCLAYACKVLGVIFIAW